MIFPNRIPCRQWQLCCLNSIKKTSYYSTTFTSCYWISRYANRGSGVHTDFSMCRKQFKLNDRFTLTHRPHPIDRSRKKWNRCGTPRGENLATIACKRFNPFPSCIAVIRYDDNCYLFTIVVLVVGPQIVIGPMKPGRLENALYQILH